MEEYSLAFWIATSCCLLASLVAMIAVVQTERDKGRIADILRKR